MFSVNIESTKSDTVHELDRRFRNPFWVWFALAWITWNWRVWYLTFFVSESLVGNKIARIQEMYEYFGWHALFWILINWIIIPTAISWSITFYLPKLTDIFLKRQKENKEREDIILRKDLKSEEKNIKAVTDLLEAERKKAQEELRKTQLELQIATSKSKNNNKIKSEEEIWNNEYVKFLKVFPSFHNTLTSLIYKNNWYSKGVNRETYIPEHVQLLHVNNLIELIDGKDTQYKITEKGKYFLKKQSLKEDQIL